MARKSRDVHESKWISARVIDIIAYPKEEYSMTNYALPTDEPIGTVLYWNGDIVWYNGVAWQPIVTGSTKLNETAAEIVADEAVEKADVAALQAEIDAIAAPDVAALQAEVAALKAIINTMQDQIVVLQASVLIEQVNDLEDRVYALEHRLNF